jgi:hypothetical protein
MLDVGIEKLDARIAWLTGQIAIHQAELDATTDVRDRYARAVGSTAALPFFRDTSEHMNAELARAADADGQGHRPTLRQNGIAIDEDGTYRPLGHWRDIANSDATHIGDLAAAIIDGLSDDEARAKVCAMRKKEAGQ